MAHRPAATNLDDLTPFLVSGSAGDHIYRRGDRGRHLYIIRVGEIQLTWHDGVTREPPERLSTGEFFGEQALFGDASRDGSARATTDYQLVRIDRQTFDRIVAEDPIIAVGMLRRL